MTWHDCGRRGEQGGFAYLMLAIVLAAIGSMAVMAAPIASGRVDGARRADARRALASIRSALEAYFEDHAAFPASLTTSGFHGVYLAAGVGGSVAADVWGSNGYRYSVDVAAHTATVYSVDADGIDQGAAGTSLVVTADGNLVGSARTNLRLAIAAAAAQQYVAAGGSLTGDWSQDRVTLGLGAEYGSDGFGAPLQPVYATGGGG